ncbi:hypothetical protein AEP_02600 [Curvibacter sp. AEP1-3]|uniref:TnsA endonuclease N-terminal domain-containing protein n=1 Tax=Curvibacter sp. AEP1-3 TaxID=1844971 RepID=UPI000B571383|nr:TnsA endonuclease N-terminal domain-containing protein [Curvibacter sp. AEP1-3]ARV19526.1 hypothetical protein AEP_02600 [Curvibacter sp. AEP1-3]
MRVRKIVTRSGKRFRGKFPSRKMKTMIHWESLLELDAIHLFEFHPSIVSYYEQPSEEFYYDHEGRHRTYFPDFLLVFRSGKRLLVEVKPKALLDNPTLQNKYRAIAKRFADQDRPFRVLTEDEIRKEPLRTNLRTLRNHSKKVAHCVVDQQVQEAISAQATWRFDELSHLLGGNQHVYQHIYLDGLRMNLDAPITDCSVVHTQTQMGGQFDPFCI